MIEKVLEIIESKKAYDIVVYDYREHNPFIDTMVVASCDNIRTVHAIADDIYLTLKNDFGVNVRLEKENDSRWVLVDIHDLIVHIFLEDERNYYDVDTLWNHVKKIRDDKTNQ